MKPKNKDINDNILAEMSRDCQEQTEDKIKQAQSLDSVLAQVRNCLLITAGNGRFVSYKLYTNFFHFNIKTVGHVH